MKWYLDGVLISSEFLTAPSGPGAQPAWSPPHAGKDQVEHHYPFRAPQHAEPAEPTATRGRFPGHRDAVERGTRDAAFAGQGKAGAPVAGAPASHPSAAGMALSGAPGHAVDDAMRMEGLHERRDREAVKDYLRTGGAGMDPATTAWCAAFVNSSLQQEGVKGSGSQVATSFMNWGQPATGAIQRGDVLVKNRGHRAGETGGHVGMATGETRQGAGGLEYRMISGNSADQVRRTWESARSVIARRARSSTHDPSTSAQE